MTVLRRRDLVWLTLAQALLWGLVAWGQHGPGYMDAHYYALMGRRLAQGLWDEPFLWNYLDDPVGIPHPAFAYWMPLPAWLAALGFLLGGISRGYAAARWSFLALGLFLPAGTAWLAARLGGSRRVALLAGGLAVAAGFYLPYGPVPETFTPGLVLGLALALAVLTAEAQPHRAAPWWAVGVLGGLLYLNRVEGLLWWLAAVVALAPAWRQAPRRAGVGLLGGLLLVVLPWWGRNLAVWGTPTAPGGWRVLWLTDYDDLFLYPAAQLTPARWWQQGLAALLADRGWALRLNLGTALAVQGQVVLTPLMLWGAWRLRRRAVVRWGALGWAALFALMTLVFPFPGARGGFFHGGAVVQPLLWALAAHGFAALAAWGQARRGWQPNLAWRVLGGGLLLILLLLSGVVVARRVYGPNPAAPRWDEVDRLYRALGAALPATDRPVLVLDPPAWAWWHADAPALAVPDGDPTAVCAVAQRYGAAYLWLEPNHPRGLADLYANPRAVACLRYRTTVAGVHLFAVEETP